ncbi:MAG: restriction endonuclease subunit S [Gammaproteobacteria bacterium]
MTAWPKVRLGEVVSPVARGETPLPGTTYRQVGVKLWGEGAYERESIDGAQTKYAQLFRTEEGDIIVNKIWARNGSVAVISAPLAGCYGSGEFPMFAPIRERLDPRWMHWLTKTQGFWFQCDDKSRGTSGKNRIRPERFLEIEIPLSPLPEQRRIVARIEELAAKIHEARILRDQAAEEAEVLMAVASAKLFEPKRGWQTKQVGDFCEPPQYGYTESATKEAVGPRFLRITDIQDGRVNWKRVPYCRCPEPAKYLLKPNDLVFARTGATTGKSFVIRHCPEAVFASYLIRLRVRDTVSVNYLYRYFQSPSYWEQIADEKKGTGQPNLSGSKLEKLKVPIAPPPDQRRIVAELDALQAQVDALRRLQAEAAAELDALLPAVLDKAFRGELQV